MRVANCCEGCGRDTKSESGFCGRCTNRRHTFEVDFCKCWNCGKSFQTNVIDDDLCSKCKQKAVKNSRKCELETE